MARIVPKAQIPLDRSGNEHHDRLVAKIDDNFNLLFDSVGALSDAPGAVAKSGTYVSDTTPADVTVANTNVTAKSQIFITLKTVGGTPHPQVVDTITPGTGFTAKANASGDTSTYNYLIVG